MESLVNGSRAFPQSNFFFDLSVMELMFYKIYTCAHFSFVLYRLSEKKNSGVLLSARETEI